MKLFRQILLLAILSTIFLLPVSAHAFDINNPSPGGSTICSGTATTTSYCADTAGTVQNDIYGPHGVISDAINIISFIAGVAAVIVLMIGGFRFIVSGGDSNSVSGARNMIIYAMIGILIISAAQIITRFIIAKL